MSDEQDQSNSGLTKENLLREAGTFGRASGMGANSRPSLAMRYLEAAFKLPDVGPDDAKEIYNKFSQAEARSKGIEHKVGSSANVQVSKLKRFGELGQLPRIDGVEVMTRAVEVISRMARLENSPIVGSTYDNMVKVARVQLSQPNSAMTEAEIEAAITPDRKDKTIVDRLVDNYKSLSKTFDEAIKSGTSDVDNLSAAIENVAEQIKALGGDLPPVTKAEKDRAKLIELAAKQGMVITPAGNNVPVETNVEADETMQMLAAFEQA